MNYKFLDCITVEIEFSERKTVTCFFELVLLLTNSAYIEHRILTKHRILFFSQYI